MAFKFNIGQDVVITQPNKVGFVKGRAEYVTGSPNSYWVQFVDGHGDLVAVWYDEQDLSYPQD